MLQSKKALYPRMRTGSDTATRQVQHWPLTTLQQSVVTHACTTPGDGSRGASAPCCAMCLHTCMSQQQLEPSAVQQS